MWAAWVASPGFFFSHQIRYSPPTVSAKSQDSNTGLFPSVPLHQGASMAAGVEPSLVLPGVQWLPA